MLDIALVQLLITSVMGLFPQIPQGITNFVSSLTSQLPQLVASGTDIEAFIQTQIATVRSMVAENRDPTDAEWDALNATVAQEMAKLRAQGSPSV